jgi:hypothetical protein
MCCHQHLSIDREVTHNGLVYSTVSDEGGNWQTRVLPSNRCGYLRDCERTGQDREGLDWRLRCGGRLPVMLARAELARQDAQGMAVVELVALGQTALAAFPAVDVVQHAAGAGDGGVAAVAPGLDEAAGHLGLGPALGFALLA